MLPAACLLMLISQRFYLTLLQLEHVRCLELDEEPEADIWNALFHLLGESLEVSEELAGSICLSFCEC